MLVENQKIQQKWNKRNKQWYVDKGYKFTEFKDVFYVSPTDLTNGSHIKVDVMCDYCRNIVSVAWKDYVKYKYDKYSCKHCRQAKTNEYNLTKRQRYLYDGIVSVCKEKGYTLLTPIEYIKTAETRVKYDKIKEEYCKSNNIYLLVIPYWDFDFINDILDETLNLHDDIV